MADDKEIFPSSKVEPCVSCGEETASGSAFYSDRREAKTPEGAPYFVCSECLKRVHHGDHYVDLDDPDLYRALTSLGAWQFTTTIIG